MSEFKPVLLTLPSLTPSLALEILPHGLTLHRFIVQADGRTHDIVIGPELPEDHVKQKYTNTIVGRYANRIPVGTHILERNGIKSEFVVQANGDHLSSPTTAYAIFRLVSPDGDQGYPGKLIVEALVALIGPGEQERKYRTPADVPQAIAPEYDLGSIVLTYRAKIDEGKEVVTPINLTQHWGFNLEASLREGPLATVKEHILTIKSDRVAELGTDALATGAFLLAKDHPSHVHSGKKIGHLFPEQSYDDFYLLQNPGSSQIPTRIPLSSFNSKLDLIKDIVQPSNDEQGNPTRGNRLAPVVELCSEKSGIKLVFDTNQPGVMFYANGLATAASGARKKIHGGSGISGHGDSYSPGTAAFLEFHQPLAAFLDPKNKDGDDTLLTTDELYHNYVRCDVRFKEVADSELFSSVRDQVALVSVYHRHAEKPSSSYQNCPMRWQFNLTAMSSRIFGCHSVSASLVSIHLRMMPWKFAPDLPNDTDILGASPYGELNSADARTKHGIQTFPPILSSANGASASVSLYDHISIPNLEPSDQRVLQYCSIEDSVHLSVASMALTSLLFVLTLLVLMTLMRIRVSQTMLLRKDLRSGQLAGIIVDVSTIQSLPQRPSKAGPLPVISPLRYTTMVYFGSPRDRDYFKTFPFTFRLALATVFPDSPVSPRCLSFSSTRFPTGLKADSMQVKGSDVLGENSIEESRTFVRDPVSDVDEICCTRPSKAHRHWRDFQPQTSYLRTDQTMLLYTMLDDLGKQILDRSLASSMYAPNPEECHPSYAYLSSLEGSGESRSLAASMHSPYRLFMTVTYDRLGRAHLLLDRAPFERVPG
ncbi:hypothetical protein D9615_009094 [Tricholomella constricta]|uniref:Uncharacterized protein n=1 Tax=Tricholomella constricta TaxID=117010 RepID=A0A8H5LYY4_9AGAR|nr:hypothetical protein D9615_009094 [Tricholomella constricta]